MIKTPSLPKTAEDLESALIVASLAHATSRTPKDRRLAWERLLVLKELRDLRRKAG